MASQKDKELWKQFLETSHNYRIALATIHNSSDNFIDLLRYILMNSVNAQIMHTRDLIDLLNAEQLKRVFPEVFRWAVDPNNLHRWFQNKVLSLPMDWLKENIEVYAETYLSNYHLGSYEEYASILSLYFHIEKKMCLNLAIRASKHHDADIREMGEEWIKDLE